MKKLKNKFIIAVIFVIVLIIFSQVFVAYSNSNVDTNSYLTLVKWNATLNESYIQIWEKNILSVWDKIRVIWDSSLAVIDWGDGSVTRLGGNTKISIEQNQISRDFTKINISFDLIAWKTWSNIISFIGKDSSFTQTFDGIEAGVRGTVFDVDLTKDFIHVTDHQVTLQTAEGKTITLSQGDVLKLWDFSLINISEFISSLEDAAWKEINQSFDKEYLQELKVQLSETLEERNPFLFILEWFSPKYKLLYTLDTAQQYSEVEKVLAKISDAKKESVYKWVLSRYQKMNFVSTSDYEFYKRKVFYQKALISLADERNKENLVRTVSYDVAEMIQTGKMQWFSESISSLLENQDILQKIDVSILKDELNYIPEWLRIEFWESLKDLEGLMNIEKFKGMNLDDAGEKIQDGLDSLDSGIQNFLNENATPFLEKIVQ